MPKLDLLILDLMVDTLFKNIKQDSEKWSILRNIVESSYISNERNDQNPPDPGFNYELIGRIVVKAFDLDKECNSLEEYLLSGKEEPTNYKWKLKERPSVEKHNCINYLKKLCEILGIETPLIAYGADPQHEENNFNIVLASLRQNPRPVIAWVSWNQIACNQKNLDELLNYGLKSITHVLHFNSGKTCILELIPNWKESPVLFFYNPCNSTNTTNEIHH